MNINKNKSIRKGFIFSKAIFPAVGAFLLATQTGCSGYSKGLGLGEKKGKFIDYVNLVEKKQGTNPYTYIYADEIEPHMVNGTKVVSCAKKFLIFVPKLNKPFVFRNPTDTCVQSVNGKDKNIIIINAPTEEQVIKIQNKIKELSSDFKIKLYNNGLKKLYNYIVKDLRIKDIYSSGTEYTNTNLTRIANDTFCHPNYCGLYQRNRQVYIANFYPGKVLFDSANTSTPQEFPKGVVIVRDKDNIQAIQPDIFITTYTLKNGKRLCPVKCVN